LVTDGINVLINNAMSIVSGQPIDFGDYLRSKGTELTMNVWNTPTDTAAFLAKQFGYSLRFFAVKSIIQQGDSDSDSEQNSGYQ
jgi:hypothetical protein